jgi:hypothetical protein
MLNRINPEISVGFVVASLFWIAVLGWQSSYSLSENEKQRCYDEAKKTGHKDEECKSFWERTTSDPIAFFTFTLSIVTLALGAISVRQFHYLKRSDETARITAEAAKKSADAAVAVESARLFFFPGSHNYWEAVGQYADRWPNSPQMGPIQNTVYARFAFKNYGKTPAILKEVRAALEHRKEPPEMLGGFAPYLGLPVERVIGHGLLTEFKLEIPHFFTMGEAIAMNKDEGAIWLRGSVVYDDVFERECTHWFMYRLNRTGGFIQFYEKSNYPNA